MFYMYLVRKGFVWYKCIQWDVVVVCDMRKRLMLADAAMLDYDSVEGCAL